MKQPRSWLEECLNVADEFYVFVITATDSVSTVKVEKDVAATLIANGAEYGYLNGMELIIGATPTDLESMQSHPTTEDVPSARSVTKVLTHEVTSVPVPYSDVDVAIQGYLDDGWEVVTSYQTHENLVLVFKRIKNERQT